MRLAVGVAAAAHIAWMQCIKRKSGKRDFGHLENEGFFQWLLAWLGFLLLFTTENGQSFEGGQVDLTAIIKSTHANSVSVYKVIVVLDDEEELKLHSSMEASGGIR